jgi:hypothetical protein
MTLTVQQYIHARSTFRIGPEGDKTSSELAVLESSASRRLSNIVGGRTFSTDETTEMRALLVLDMLQNEHGKGVITSENVTDSSWKSEIKTSSAWMDEIYSRIAEYDSNIGVVTDLTEEADIDGVLRDDHYIEGLSEGHPVRLPHRRY